MKNTLMISAILSALPFSIPTYACKPQDPRNKQWMSTGYVYVDSNATYLKIKMPEERDKSFNGENPFNNAVSNISFTGAGGTFPFFLFRKEGSFVFDGAGNSASSVIVVRSYDKNVCGDRKKPLCETATGIPDDDPNYEQDMCSEPFNMQSPGVKHIKTHKTYYGGLKTDVRWDREIPDQYATVQVSTSKNINHLFSVNDSFYADNKNNSGQSELRVKMVLLNREKTPFTKSYVESESYLKKDPKLLDEEKPEPSLSEIVSWGDIVSEQTIVPLSIQTSAKNGWSLFSGWELRGWIYTNARKAYWRPQSSEFMGRQGVKHCGLDVFLPKGMNVKVPAGFTGAMISCHKSTSWGENAHLEWKSVNSKGKEFIRHLVFAHLEENSCVNHGQKARKGMLLGRAGCTSDVKSQPVKKLKNCGVEDDENIGLRTDHVHVVYYYYEKGKPETAVRVDPRIILDAPIYMSTQKVSNKLCPFPSQPAMESEAKSGSPG